MNLDEQLLRHICRTSRKEASFYSSFELIEELFKKGLIDLRGFKQEIGKFLTARGFRKKHFWVSRNLKDYDGDYSDKRINK